MTGPADAARWLERREPPAPPALRERMLEALRAVAGDGDGDAAGSATAARPAETAGWLAEAALDRLRAVLASTGGRAAALDLLAADALLTYACEAAAEAGPETLAAVARAYGPARLAETLSGGSP